MNEPYNERPLGTADLAGAAEQRQQADRHAGMQQAPPEGLEREAPAPLFSSEQAGLFQSRWLDVQAGFVDDPRRAVAAADQLVAELMQRLAEEFAQERNRLEHQWDREGNASTEDLRIALQRYRSFFHRLLSL